jgi:hypothetical protein
MMIARSLTAAATKLSLAPTLSVGANIGTLRVPGRRAAELLVPTQSVGTRRNLPQQD